jgi:PAS domain S-box-containing protein
MDARESLTVRTVSALQRLADLESRGRTVTGEKAGVLKTALRELEAALEELRTASEQLNELMDGMAVARHNVSKTEAEFREFRDALPIACVWTDATGQIVDANPLAGDLLNVAAKHLRGKPLALYMVDRDQFFRMIATAERQLGSPSATLEVRPRERKARPVAVHVSLLREAGALSWFFQEAPAGR